MSKVTRKPDKRSVAEAVRKYIKDCHPSGLTLEVDEHGVRQEQYWWYVPVRPDREPPKLFEYYEALAEVEGALEENENLTVLLVPAGSNAGAGEDGGSERGSEPGSEVEA